MKNYALVGLLLSLTISLAFANTKIIPSFEAESDSKTVTITWSTNEEKDISEFCVERSVNSAMSFNKITTVKAKGKPSNYSVIDANAYKEIVKQSTTLQGDNEYFYRIKIVYNNGNYEYSTHKSVVHKTSKVVKTWGMIKEMMR